MFKNHLPTVFSSLAIVAALAAPAVAAESLESKLQVCDACHGANGVPISADIPIIWGQTEYMLVKQLHDYRTGDRENAVMAVVAKAFDQKELRPVAQYFSKKQWPARATPAAAANEPDGMQVCQICHQPAFAGALPAPRLAGQSYEYLIKQMNAFANGDRSNNADMVKLMQGTTQQQREAMARYIAGL